MHYFSYAYIILIIASTFDKYNGFFAALIFALGWVTYTSAQFLFRGKKYYTYLFYLAFKVSRIQGQFVNPLTGFLFAAISAKPCSA